MESGKFANGTALAVLVVTRDDEGNIDVFERWDEGMPPSHANEAAIQIKGVAERLSAFFIEGVD